MSKRIKIIFLCMIVFILLFACKDKNSDPQKLSIAVIPKGTTHMFWQSIHAGALKAEHELNIEVLWMGPEKEDDRQQQIALVDNQVMNQVSGIVLAPLDKLALRRPVRNAVEKNVPVLIIDSGLADSVFSYYIKIEKSFLRTGNLYCHRQGKDYEKINFDNRVFTGNRISQSLAVLK